MHRSRRSKRSGGKKNRQKYEKSIRDDHNEEGDDEDEEDNEEKKRVYTIQTSEVMGRYLVAARDLQPGDVIMSEDALVVGPSQGCRPVCLGCYKHLDRLGKVHTCERCGWPMCSAKCIGQQQHEPECSLFSARGVRVVVTDYSEENASYNCIVPLRCLLLKTKRPDKWETLMTMEAHNEVRRKLSLWQVNQSTVVDRIRKDWGMTEFDEELIHTVCGILEVNAFEIGQHGISIRGLFPSAFYMAHDCVPNTNHTDDDRFRLTVRASTNIPQGQAITVGYAYTLQGTMKRREHLIESKFFECQCKRCSDPTELGTYMSALKCPKCETGYVLSTAPLNDGADWKCTNCNGYTVKAQSIRLLLDRISDQVEAIDANDVVAFEAFLQRYRNVLHPHHYHMVGVKHSLSQLYGKIMGYIIYELTDPQLERKRDICREILKLFDVLEPGWSRLRGVTLYELHAPIMILATRNFESRTILKAELRKRLKEAASCLEESHSILKFEPETSSEGMMATAAQDALQRLSEMLNRM